MANAYLVSLAGAQVNYKRGRDLADAVDVTTYTIVGIADGAGGDDITITNGVKTVTVKLGRLKHAAGRLS